MQQRVNNKTKVSQKRDSQSNVQIQKQAEESSNAQTHDYNPLENVTCKIGDNACAAKHVSVIQRAGLFHPMNESQKVQSLLRLQQQYGNRFVQRVIAQHIQAKLQVNQPGDVYEKEADQVADAVMQIPEPQVQRQPIEEEEEELQAKELPGRAPDITPNLEAHINAIKGGGQALPEPTRAFFEPRFGYDFSHVRVHSDAETDTLNRALNARAFTTGQDIFFRQGAYNPGSSSGRELLAHELTHVVQQGGEEQKIKQSLSRSRGFSNNFIQRRLLPTGVRRMVPSEITMARRVYGSSIAYGMVFISNATGIGGRPYTLHVGNKFIIIQVGSSAYSTPGSNRNLLIHELAHSWQCQHGITGNEYMVNSIASQAVGGRGAYCYVPGRWFGRYGAEQIAQQAERGVTAIVSHMSSATPLSLDSANIAGMSVPHWETPGAPGVVC